MVHMAQASAEREVTAAGSRKGVRRGLLLGVIVGVVATIVLGAVAWAALQALPSGARTFTSICSGANVTGTIWVDDSGVFTSVAVVDPKTRSWDIRWGDYAEEVGGSTMIPTSGADYSGSLLSATQTLGDIDGGTHRTAQVRPHGHQAWCALDMHVSSLW